MVLLVVDQAHNGGHDILHGCLQLGMAPRPYCTNGRCVTCAFVTAFAGKSWLRSFCPQLSMPSHTGSLRWEGRTVRDAERALLADAGLYNRDVDAPGSHRAYVTLIV